MPPFQALASGVLVEAIMRPPSEATEGRNERKLGVAVDCALARPLVSARVNVALLMARRRLRFMQTG